MRDLTVPTGMPSTAAVSCSPRSSTKRQPARCDRARAVSRARRQAAVARCHALAAGGRYAGSAARSARPSRRRGCARGCAPRWPRSRAARAKLGAPAETAQRQPSAHERLLRGLLGIRRRAGDQIRGSESDRLVLLDERFVGARVATPRAHGAIIRRLGPAVHALLLHLGSGAGSRGSVAGDTQEARDPVGQVQFHSPMSFISAGTSRNTDDDRVDQDRRGQADAELHQADQLPA